MCVCDSTTCCITVYSTNHTPFLRAGDCNACIPWWCTEVQKRLFPEIFHPCSQSRNKLSQSQEGTENDGSPARFTSVHHVNSKACNCHTEKYTVFNIHQDQHSRLHGRACNSNFYIPCKSRWSATDCLDREKPSVVLVARFKGHQIINPGNGRYTFQR